MKEPSDPRLDVTKRVALLNAYASIKGKPPRVGKFGEEIQYSINREFDAWVSAKLEELMGGSQKTVATGFSDGETRALKALAAKVLASEKIAKEPQAAENRRLAAPLVGPSKARGQSGQSPLVDPDEWRRVQETMLRELRKLENDGPDY